MGEEVNKNSDDLTRDLDEIVEMRSALSSASPTTTTKRKQQPTRVIRKPQAGRGARSSNKPTRSLAAYEEAQKDELKEEQEAAAAIGSNEEEGGYEETLVVPTKPMNPSTSSKKSYSSTVAHTTPVRKKKQQLLNKKINSADSTSSSHSQSLVNDTSAVGLADQSDYLDKLEYSKEYSMLVTDSPAPAGGGGDHSRQEAVMNLSLESSLLSSQEEDIEETKDNITPLKSHSSTSRKSQEQPANDSITSTSSTVTPSSSPSPTMIDSIATPPSNNIKPNRVKKVGPSSRAIESPLNSMNTGEYASDEENNAQSGGLKADLYNEIMIKFGSGPSGLSEEVIDFFRSRDILTIASVQNVKMEYVLQEAKRIKMKQIHVKKLKEFILNLSSSLNGPISPTGPPPPPSASKVPQQSSPLKTLSFSSGQLQTSTSLNESLNVRFLDNSSNRLHSSDGSPEKRRNSTGSSSNNSNGIMKAYAYILTNLTFSANQSATQSKIMNSFGKYWVKKWFVLTKQFLIVYSNSKILKCESAIPIRLCDLVTLRDDHSMMLYMHDGTKIRIKFISSNIAYTWKTSIYESMIHAKDVTVSNRMQPPTSVSSSQLLIDSIATIYELNNLNQRSRSRSLFHQNLAFSKSVTEKTNSSGGGGGSGDDSNSSDNGFMSNSSSTKEGDNNSNKSTKTVPPHLVVDVLYESPSSHTMLLPPSLLTTSCTVPITFLNKDNEENIISETTGWKAGCSSGVWHKRCFILTKNEIIYYRKQASREIHVKKISLKSCCLVVRGSSNSEHQKCTLKLHFLNSLYKILIKFENEETTKAWKNMLYNITVLHNTR
jgi:hypothetical protein